MITDPIGDMLTRIRNAILNHSETVEIPASKLREAVLGILKKEGYIADFKTKDKKEFPKITVELLYKNGQPALQRLERVSRPGLRIYTPSSRIPRILSGYGLVILSTPQGIMSGRDARKKGVGGEIICKAW
ncbi:MAG: 30S ribosomal protein S8 [bacterium]|nr:30S ribosomal protein S8 [bacterium]